MRFVFLHEIEMYFKYSIIFDNRSVNTCHQSANSICQNSRSIRFEFLTPEINIRDLRTESCSGDNKGRSPHKNDSSREFLSFVLATKSAKNIDVAETIKGSNFSKFELEIF